MGTGSLSRGVKRLGRGAEVKDRVELCLYSSLYAVMAGFRVNFIFTSTFD
jgi:hypothetical protein